jgi:hypothetical protein
MRMTLEDIVSYLSCSSAIAAIKESQLALYGRLISTFSSKIIKPEFWNFSRNFSRIFFFGPELWSRPELGVSANNGNMRNYNTRGYSTTT